MTYQKQFYSKGEFMDIPGGFLAAMLLIATVDNPTMSKKSFDNKWRKIENGETVKIGKHTYRRKPE